MTYESAWAPPREVACKNLDEALAALCGPISLPALDPEIRYFRKLERQLTADPAGFASRVEFLGSQRLHEVSSLENLRGLLARLMRLYEDRLLVAYACAEAMQICLADLVTLEELQETEVPESSVHALRDGLLVASVDLVARLMRNLATRAQIIHKARPADDDSKVRRLSDFIAELRQPPAIPHDPDSPLLVVATAGRGTRLRSTIPKGLVPIEGIPMVIRIVQTALEAGIEQFVFVLKYRADVQIDYLSRWGVVLLQDQAEGTGHTVITALEALQKQIAPVLVCYSDTPFLTRQSFIDPIEAVQNRGAELAIATFRTTPSDEVGHILRDAEGAITRIGQRRLGSRRSDEGDGGVYVFQRSSVLEALGATRNDNVRYEYAFTDVVATLVDAGGHVCTARGPAEDYMSVNRPRDLVLARLRAATGAVPTLVPPNEQQREAALRFFVKNGAEVASARALNAYLDDVASLVGPVLDLSSERSVEVPRNER
ncbi:MAG: NTP transferase domain-containing protein [Actinomycetota bacterium]|nr:NTP transferase domain-containing protein [Actinomycetota bacterium]